MGPVDRAGCPPGAREREREVHCAADCGALQGQRDPRRRARRRSGDRSRGGPREVLFGARSQHCVEEPLGHVVHPAGLRFFGGAQAVQVDSRSGVYLGASDPRKDGAALAY